MKIEFYLDLVKQIETMHNSVANALAYLSGALEGEKAKKTILHKVT